MSGIQSDLGPKGFQAIEAAINTDPDVPAFIQRFKPGFPVGVADNVAAMNYMQLSPMVRSFVPFVFIVDRAGMIREQYTGSDPFLGDETSMEKNIRTAVLKLLDEHSKPVHRTSGKR